MLSNTELLSNTQSNSTLKPDGGVSICIGYRDGCTEYLYLPVDKAFSTLINIDLI